MKSYVKHNIKQTLTKISAAFAVFLILILMAGCSGQTSGSSESGTPVDDPVSVSVASLKGPTSIGLAGVMNDADNKATEDTYTFDVQAQADAVVASLTQGTTNIALLPANVAATVYNKTKGTANAIQVLNINTLGVLYIVTGDTSVNSISDLKGHTIYLSGKGTTPDYALQYLLGKSGLSTSDVDLEYKSEPEEVVAMLTADNNAIGLLPEPYVSATEAKVPALTTRVSLTDAWNVAAQDNDSDSSSSSTSSAPSSSSQAASQLVTGVTVVRSDFLKAHPSAVTRFLAEEQKSVDYVNDNPSDAAQVVKAKSILPITDVNVIGAAIPRCNIVYKAGGDMKSALSGYLQTLYDANPASVGGAMPGDDFYYNG